MFRLKKMTSPSILSFPRVRGDVPNLLIMTLAKTQFSPRARGCSGTADQCEDCIKVFPACAGMFRRPSRNTGPISRFPRVRGDVPLVLTTYLGEYEFSPRARGCSLMMQLVGSVMRVFPACAGMFPLEKAKSNEWTSFPRVRGDVPSTLENPSDISRFSPRARGCTEEASDAEYERKVFPACAGMFRRRKNSAPKNVSFPRVRGDVPVGSITCISPLEFSPRARGCSGHTCILRGPANVFPACAGMFRRKAAHRAAPQCFPRVRGDVPVDPYFLD